MSLSLSARALAIEPSMIRALRDQAHAGCLDLGLGQADLHVCQPALDAAARHIEGGRAAYSPNLGLPELRAAVAARYGIDATQVMITCGVQEALAVAMLGVVEPGDEVLVPDPGFPAYPNLVRMAQASPVPYALTPGTWDLDPDAVAQAISPKTRAIVLNSPSNPTGTIASSEALRDVLAVCAEHGVVWISDEIYEDYIYGEATHLSPADLAAYKDDGFRLGGLSKSHHMMGWRIGWLTGSAEIVEGLKPMHQHLVTCAPTVAQIAGAAALGVHEDVVAQTMEVFRGRRRLSLEILSSIEGVEVSPAHGAFYLFLDVHRLLRTGEDSLAMALALLAEEEVVVIPGSGFGPSGEGHLRVAYTIEEARLAEALGRLKRFLERRIS